MESRVVSCVTCLFVYLFICLFDVFVFQGPTATNVEKLTSTD